MATSEFPCDALYHLNNTDNRNVLPLVTVGIWFLCIVSGFGIVNGVLTLTIFVQLQWHRKRQYFLLFNLAIVELLNSCTFLSGSTVQLIQLYWNVTNVVNQAECILLWIPSNTAMTCSEILAFFIAADRFYSICYPFKWIQMSRRYWQCLVIIAWSWAFTLEAGWLLFSDSTLCVQTCTFAPFPDSWWSSVVKASDITLNVGVVALYTVIPVLAPIAMKQCFSRFKFATQHRIQQQQHNATIRRIQGLSALMIVCFVCTYGVSFVLADFDYLSGIGNYYLTTTIVQQITACLLASNSFVLLFLFILRDDTFRGQSKKLLQNVVCINGDSQVIVFVTS